VVGGLRNTHSDERRVRHTVEQTGHRLGSLDANPGLPRKGSTLTGLAPKPPLGGWGRPVVVWFPKGGEGGVLGGWLFVNCIADASIL